MATLRDDIEQWQTQVATALATAKELYGLSNQLSGCPQNKFGRLIAQLKVLCEKSTTEMLVVTKQLEEIKSRWGSCLIPINIESKDWDKWQRGLEDKLPKNENYDQDLESLLNTWKGDNWGLFIEQNILSFQEWHMEGKMFDGGDIDSPYLAEKIVRPTSDRTEAEKQHDKQMLKVNVEGAKHQYDAVKKAEYLDPNLAKEVAEFKLRWTAYKASQARIQAEDLAIESAKQGKPSQMTYYFFEKPSDKQINSILKIYQETCEQNPGSKVEVKFYYGWNRQ